MTMETFIDNRDGESYKIAKIGNLLWFAENLRYQGVEHHFPNRDSDNVPEYGCLYTWGNAKAACPEGWRLPTKNEFEELLGLIGANINNSSPLRNESWKNGKNSSKFSAMPAGNRSSNGSSNHFGSYAFFWSATPCDSDGAYSLDVNSGFTGVVYNYILIAVSVRYVREV